MDYLTLNRIKKLEKELQKLKTRLAKIEKPKEEPKPPKKASVFNKGDKVIFKDREKTISWIKDIIEDLGDGPYIVEKVKFGITSYLIELVGYCRGGIFENRFEHYKEEPESIFKPGDKVVFKKDENNEDNTWVQQVIEKLGDGPYTVRTVNKSLGKYVIVLNGSTIPLWNTRYEHYKEEPKPPKEEPIFKIGDKVCLRSDYIPPNKGFWDKEEFQRTLGEPPWIVKEVQETFLRFEELKGNGCRVLANNGEVCGRLVHYKEEEPQVDKAGTKRWYNKEGKLHRIDGPAVEWADGDKRWCKEGKLHRIDGPAIEYANGTERWYKNGKLHREDGPAFECINGTKCWHKNGQLHRDDGQPAIEFADGDKRWYKNGKLHREDGPAVVDANGRKEWYNNGERIEKPTSELTVDENGYKRWHNKTNQLHREDGPAIEYPGGGKEWWINGKRHRDGAPAIESSSGRKEWHQHDQLHREDGPAIIFADGMRCWYKKGLLHREDSPAIIRANGTKEWYQNGEKITEPVPEPTVDASGTKRWRNKEGKLHREDGPAIEYSNGTREWYKEGQLHREGSPAITYQDGTNLWYNNGQRMPTLTKEEPKPTIAVFIRRDQLQKLPILPNFTVDKTIQDILDNYISKQQKPKTLLNKLFRKLGLT